MKLKDMDDEVKATLNSLNHQCPARAAVFSLVWKCKAAYSFIHGVSRNFFRQHPHLIKGHARIMCFMLISLAQADERGAEELRRHLKRLQQEWELRRLIWHSTHRFLQGILRTMRGLGS